MKVGYSDTSFKSGQTGNHPDSTLIHTHRVHVQEVSKRIVYMGLYDIFAERACIQLLIDRDLVEMIDPG